MVKREDLYGIAYYKKSAYYGSAKPDIRFRIALDMEKGKLEAAVWKEPYCYDVTPEEEIERKEFPADDEDSARLQTGLTKRRNRESGRGKQFGLPIWKSRVIVESV